MADSAQNSGHNPKTDRDHPLLASHRAATEEGRWGILHRYLGRLLGGIRVRGNKMYAVPLEANGYILGEGAFTMLLIEPDGYSAGNEFRSMDDMYRQLIEYVSEDLSSYCINYATELDGRVVVLICFPSATSQELSEDWELHACETTCRIAADGFLSDYNVSIRAYLSEMVNGTRALARTYELLLSASRYCKAFFPDGDIIVRVKSADRRQTARILSEAAEAGRRLADNIISGMDVTPDTARYLDGMIDELPYSYEHLFARLHTFTGAFLRKIYEYMPDESIPDKELDLLPDLLCAENATELKRAFLSWVNAISKTVRLAPGQPENKYAIQSVIRFIDENINNSWLSAQAIADEFGISPSLLSTRFKHERGEKLIDYLHKKRLECAVRMLQETRLSMAEICSNSGYASISTMNRAFKKYLNASPTSFR